MKIETDFQIALIAPKETSIISKVENIHDYLLRTKWCKMKKLTQFGIFSNVISRRHKMNITKHHAKFQLDTSTHYLYFTGRDLKC